MRFNYSILLFRLNQLTNTDIFVIFNNILEIQERKLKNIFYYTLYQVDLQRNGIVQGGFIKLRAPDLVEYFLLLQIHVNKNNEIHLKNKLNFKKIFLLFYSFSKYMRNNLFDFCILPCIDVHSLLDFELIFILLCYKYDSCYIIHLSSMLFILLFFTYLHFY